MKTQTKTVLAAGLVALAAVASVLGVDLPDVAGLADLQAAVREMIGMVP